MNKQSGPKEGPPNQIVHKKISTSLKKPQNSKHLHSNA